MTKELANFDPTFFEELEDLKFNYNIEVKKNIILEEQLKKLAERFGVEVDIPTEGSLSWEGGRGVDDSSSSPKTNHEGVFIVQVFLCACVKSIFMKNVNWVFYHEENVRFFVSLPKIVCQNLSITSVLLEVFIRTAFMHLMDMLHASFLAK